MAARRSLAVLVLAAGKGTRFRSKLIKLLHPVAGRPMVCHALGVAATLRPQRSIVVVGYQADAVRAALHGVDCTFVLQKEQRGTGHAVLQAAAQLTRKAPQAVLILSGDLPTLRATTLKTFVERHRRSRATLSVLTAKLADPTGYGRIVRGLDGAFQRIVEHRDASAEQRRIREINTGIYCANPVKLIRVLRRVRPDNAQGEYYVTDAVHSLVARGEKTIAVCHDEATEVLGVNNREELAQAARTLYGRHAATLQERGVTFLDAARTWIDPQARIGRDTVVYPDVIVEGPSVIGEDCVVRPGCRITRSRIGNGVEIKDHTVVLDSRVGHRVSVGPFAHLRPGAVLEDGSKVGNFVELKKTRLGRGSKASHLSYLGDATIGPDCNIGAGTITCNYDGERKNTTTLARGVFIGSNSQLVAPVKLGKGAYVAAGSTVTEDVPAGALAIARSRQRNVTGWKSRRADGKPKTKK